MQTPTHPLHLILADDDEDDRFFFREAIHAIHPEIIISDFEDGELLLQEIEKITDPPPPHIIFLDINMPKSNGIECLQQIRKRPQFCNVPVIMYTTSENDKDIVEAYNCGATLFIRKAYSQQENVDTLQKVLKGYEEHTLKNIPKDAFFVGGKSSRSSE